MTELDAAWLDTSLTALRYAAIERELDAIQVRTDLSARGRAELAIRSRGPVSDLLIAARRANAGAWPDRERYAAAAARALAAIGATELARKVMADASIASAGPRPGRGEQQLLRSAESDADVHERRWARRELAKLLRARRDWSGARAHSQHAYDLAPEADDAARVSFEAALDAWAAGDVACAIAAAKRARDSEPQVAELLDLLERDTERAARGPRWTRFAGELRVAKHASGVLESLGGTGLVPEGMTSDDEPATMGHVAHALRRAGVRVMRLSIDLGAFERCLRAGAALVVEEERPVGRAFRFVQDVDTGAQILAVREPHEEGVELVTLEHLRKRAALFGGSTLVVLGLGDAAEARQKSLAAEGVTHASIFDRLDACDVDEDGQSPPRARVFQLSRALLDELPDCQPARRRLGEALLAAWRSGETDFDEVVAWYAEARERFPRAEWPTQVHAQLLEESERWSEAAIAFADAQRADPLDWRNHLGHGRTLWSVGRVRLAQERFRAAAALAPGLIGPYLWMARCALQLGDLDAAEVSAEIARGLDPKDPSALSILANVHEARGEAEPALDLLAAVFKMAPGASLACRLARGHAAAGRLTEARGALTALLDAPSPREPRDALIIAHKLSVHLAWMAGDARGAWKAGMDALKRFAFHDDLLAEMARILSGCFSPDDEATLLEELVAACPREPNVTTALYEKLLGRRMMKEVVEATDRIAPSLPDDANREWSRARTRLWTSRAPEERAPLAELLQQVVDKAPGFEAARIWLAALVEEREPERVLALLPRESSYYVAAAWELEARARARLGKESEAAALRQRVRSLPAAAFSRAANPLRQCGFHSLSSALVEAGRDRHPGDWGLEMEWLLELRTRGERDAALDALLRAREKHAAGVAWGVAVEIAAAAGRWDLVGLIGREQLRSLGDTRNEGHVWLHRSLVAAGELAEGRNTERKRVLEAVPFHLDALAVLVNAGRRIGACTAAEDAALLEERGPGASRRLDEVEILPWRIG
jgi:tetratricopeptide (TPR) repeat protein